MTRDDLKKVLYQSAEDMRAAFNTAEEALYTYRENKSKDTESLYWLGICNAIAERIEELEEVLKQ